MHEAKTPSHKVHPGTWWSCSDFPSQECQKKAQDLPESFILHKTPGRPR